MRSRIAVLCVGGLVASLLAAVAAHAATPGSHTAITRPGATTSVRTAFDGTNTPLTVAGTTSSDVTSVDIVCMYSVGGQVAGDELATSVAVTSGRFSATTAVGPYVPQCRLRAVPSGTPLDGYLGSFAGPLLYRWGAAAVQDGSGVPYGVQAFDEAGDGSAFYQGAGLCGASSPSTVAVPQMTVEGDYSGDGCLLTLSGADLTSSGVSTGSSLVVDGHNAYLPDQVHTYLIGAESLPVTQSRVTVTSHRASNGDLTITESDPAMRCSVSDTYPPTPTSCPALIDAGVTLHRVVTVASGSHQIQFQDSWTSTGRAHVVNAQYRVSTTAPVSGYTGYRIPGEGDSFHVPTSAQVFDRVGTTAGTIGIRYDVYGSADDPQDDTRAVTYSRAPARVQFGPSPSSSRRPTAFALPYRLTVPAGKAADLRFVVSEQLDPTGALALGSASAKNFVTVPTIASPKAGATLHGHTITVKGTVTPGANGLPTSVTVAGHPAALAATGAYSASWTAKAGTHVITVVARDVAGSTRSKTITVHLAP